MSDQDPTRTDDPDDDEVNPIDALAEEFLHSVRKGGSTAIEPWLQRHPELAEEIRSVFPGLLAMEGLKVERVRSSSGGAVRGALKIEKLGDYRILAEIGRGGMGIVYEAEQESLERRVAVKVLPRQMLLDDKQLRRFQREAQTAARLHHSNIVPVFGVGDQDGLHYYVMQLIRGVGLDQVIRELSRLRGTAPAVPTEATDVDRRIDPAARTVASALTTGAFAITATRERATSGSREEPMFFDVGTPSGRAETGPPGSGSSDTAHDAPPADAGELAGRLSSSFWKSVAGIGSQVAEALDYAHSQGVLHRDIKPSNLLVDAAGSVWITDFGIAKALEKDGLTQAGDVIGTLQYMAPEQLEGRHDARSDVYSLGLTLYELVAGRRAFEARSAEELVHKVKTVSPTPPRRLDPQVPRDLETIVLKAIARDPEHRYRNARELADDLRRFDEDRPILARRAGHAEQIWRWCRRNRLTASLAAAALLGLIGTAIGFIVGYLDKSAALERESDLLDEATKATQRAERNLEDALDAFDDIFDHVAGRDPEAAIFDADTEEGSDDAIDPTPAPSVSPKEAAQLERLLRFYDRFAEANAGNEKLEERTARAHRRVGDILFRLGQRDRAETSYREAMALWERIIARAPSDEAWIALAGLHKEIAVLGLRGRGPRDNSPDAAAREQQWQQRTREVLASYATAIEILKQKVEQPQAARTRYELVRVHLAFANSAAFLLGAGRGRLRPGGERPNGEGANGSSPRRDLEKNLKEALETSRSLVAEEPANPAFRFIEAQSLLQLAGFAAFNPERAVEGRALAEEGLKKLESLVADHPNVADYRAELLQRLARQPRGFGANAENLQRLERARELGEELTKVHPSVPSYSTELVNVLWRLGLLYDSQNELEKAEEALRRACALSANLEATGEGRSFLNADPYVLQLAQTLHRRGKDDESRGLLIELAERMERRLTEDRRRGPRGIGLDDVWGLIAKVETSLGHDEAAAAAQRRAEEEQKKRPNPRPRRPGTAPGSGDR